MIHLMMLCKNIRMVEGIFYKLVKDIKVEEKHLVSCGIS